MSHHLSSVYEADQEGESSAEFHSKSLWRIASLPIIERNKQPCPIFGMTVYFI